MTPTPSCSISLVFCPLVLAVWRRWRPVLFVALAMVGELTLFLASARAVDRPRPPVENLDGQMPTSSFPSGHIAATICVWLAITLIVFPRTDRWWRWIFVALAVLMPVGVATSRMYRGMHHPTDFMGAILLSALWIGLLYLVIRPNEDLKEGNRAGHRVGGRGHPRRRAGAGRPSRLRRRRRAAGDDLEHPHRRSGSRRPRPAGSGGPGRRRAGTGRAGPAGAARLRPGRADGRAWRAGWG